MSQLLDLRLTLTPPPAGAPAGAIANLEVRCDTLGLSPASGLLTDPFKPKERERLQWYLEEYWKWPFEQFLERAREIEHLLGEIGQRFYNQLAFDRNADRILQEWGNKETDQRQISILSEVPKALTLPWELLRDERGFLALRSRHPISIIRSLPQHQAAPRDAAFKPPLRILLVTARPEGAGFIDPRADARELMDVLQEPLEAGAVEIEFLRPPTLPALRKRLSDTKRPPIHILHFDGHGVFRGNGEPHETEQMGDQRVKQIPGQGLLAFEDTEGKLDLVSAEALGEVLQDSGVPLAVLDACQSAISDAEDAFSSVAGRLIKSGLDAVIAMSASVLVASATRYVEAFYGALAEGTPVPLAHERARQALHDDPRRHLQVRQADREPQPVELSDWWVPHFYQQRELTLQPSGQSRKRQQGVELHDLPEEPRYGFSGRARELLQIERWLWQGKLAVISGFGGVGKTAIAREAADWLTRTGMYQKALFVSFEHGGDANTLLSALGHLLGVYDGTYNPQDREAALAKLAPVLKKQPTLIIADNLESLLPGGEAPLEREARLALWETLLALSKRKAGGLLTCRDASVGDGRLEQGKAVAHLPLGGLYREDAYLLASRLLTDLSIDRARAPYAELRDLLKQLDYHPLAIQLVLPALRTNRLETILQQFAELLPQFADDAETGRNRSLLASLQYSLNRLTDEQRALLPRLALFEGGAMESEILAITEIPESTWASLRPTLEQAALLTAEQVHEDVRFPCLRFHPVLVPFLRTQPGADNPALRARYAVRYHALASYLYNEDSRNPQAVRVLALHELPNLRSALNLLLEQGEREAAIDLADSIIRFLNIFGRLRERDDLRQHLTQAFLTAGSPPDEALTQAEYLHLKGLGEDEFDRGNIQAAFARFTALRARIEALPASGSLGPGSPAHCSVVISLAKCLKERGQAVSAEAQLREALAIIDSLLKQNPENQDYLGYLSVIQTELGNTFRDQGRYTEARKAYEESLKIDKQQEDIRNQAGTLGQLGRLARDLHEYSEARARYMEARDLFQAIGEPEMVAVAWHQLGIVAQLEEEWGEAERCYRESLALEEQIGNVVGAAKTCNQLGMVAEGTGRLTEAEGWYTRALKLDEQSQPGSLDYAKHLNNLANLLVKEQRAGHMSQRRLSEARTYAERALAIKELLDASAEIWGAFQVLADIAELEGRAEVAHDYRRRARETYAAFEGNRYHIDRQHRRLIVTAAAAARGNAQAREVVEEALPQLESKGWHIKAPIERIWAGERGWHVLAEGLDRQDALLILRILETLEEPPAENEAEEGPDREKIIHTFKPFIADVVAAARGSTQARTKVEAILPEIEKKGWEVSAAIRRIWAGERDLASLVEGLDAQDTLIVGRMLDLLDRPPSQDEDTEEEEEEAEEEADGFEAFAHAVALAAGGHQEARAVVEKMLPELEAKGWHIADPIQRIWAGEQDGSALVEGLDEQDTQLIQRILNLLAREPGG